MVPENAAGTASHEEESHELDMLPFMSEMTEMESLAIQGILEANGIPFTTFGNSTLPVTVFSVNVPVALMENARRAVLEAQAAGPAAAEAAERESELRGDNPDAITDAEIRATEIEDRLERAE